MNLSRLSIDQPVLAIVASIFILVVGAIAYSRLPIAEYPEIAPPAVVIQTQYPGASAQVVADTVATPIEQEVNGVDDMLYMYSQSTSDGGVTITVTFKLGTDPDKAQVLVRNAVSIAEPRLPEEVRRFGVVTKKNSPNLMLVVFLMSPDDTYDQLYISNYALRRVRDPLLRLDGVGDIRMYGARDYSMRLWLDPDKMAEFGLAAADLLASVRSQNVQIAGGQIAEPPISDRAFQPNLTFLGRLTEPDAFENIIVKSSADGRLVRLKDIARIELGALSYSTNSFLLRKPAVALAVTQRPGTNALATADSIKALMADLEKEFPKGLVYSIAYNPTDFIAESVRELLKTVYEAIALVVFVVILFLQRWRAAIIPIIAIPVSLIGTFAVMAAFGLSINNLTLFGLVLAVGIVVDDAIVVVENVERHLSDGVNPLEAARLTMDEVGTALISIALVLAAVFVPTAFLGGISGQFFRQFAIAIAVATVISCFNSLTLSPALSSLILKSHTQARAPGRCVDAGAPVQLVLRALQPRVRSHRGALWPHRAVGDRIGAGFPRGLCGADRDHRLGGLQHAARVHSGAGPRLCDRCDPAAERIVARPHDRRGASCRGDHPRYPGRGAGAELCRIQRRDVHAVAQRRRPIPGVCAL